MIFSKLPIEGLVLVEPKIFADSRGCFFESFNQFEFEENGINFNFVQDNQSISKKNIIRGLHFQLPPFEQGKLARVTLGSAIDVVVDIRKSSPTFGKHLCIELSEANRKMLWIPPGFAHGFVALEDNTVFLYKCTAYYNKPFESGILYNDSELGINWQIASPIISEKDAALMSWKDFKNSL